MKTFLVTGCNGYIGSHMCWELRQAYPNCYIIGVDVQYKTEMSHLVNHFSLENLCTNNTEIFNQFEIDCVFHFAARTSVSESEEMKYHYYYNNLTSSLNVLNNAIRNNVKNFVFSSTCAIYGNPVYFPIKEEHPKNPESVYAKSKLMFENVLLAAQENKQINCAILRYFNASGRNQEANLYEDHEPETHLIPLLCKENEINVYGNDYQTKDGTAIRDYIHVIDVCKSHIVAYEYMVKNNRGIISNIGTGHGYTVLEIIDYVEKIMNKKIQKTFHPRRPGDTSILISDINHMKNELTFAPKYNIMDIISSMR